MKQLLAILKAHGVNAHAQGGKIAAESIYTKDGATHSQWETVEPTVYAVRCWLGY